MKMEIKQQFKKLKTDFAYRAFCSALVSLVCNLAFIVYNSYLAMKFRDGFAIGISIYYSLLFLVTLASIIMERVISEMNEEIKNKKRLINYKISSVMIFIIDFCLIAPIILMVTDPKDVAFGLIPAITMATYCVYKITFAIINYVKSKKSRNPTTILFKEINIIGAIVSILSLQHTLIMVNGGMDKSMRTLSLITSILFILLIITFSILSFLKNKKLFEKD